MRGIKKYIRLRVLFMNSEAQDSFNYVLDDNLSCCENLRKLTQREKLFVQRIKDSKTWTGPV
jgi:hypothetical protein